MDKSIFIKKLTSIFCDIQTDRKYSKVWLADADFGGLYHSGKYILNVQAEHLLEACTPEIRFVVHLLSKELKKEEFNLIRSVSVYNADEEIHCQSDDIMVYDEEMACR